MGPLPYTSPFGVPAVPGNLLEMQIPSWGPDLQNWKLWGVGAGAATPVCTQESPGDLAKIQTLIVSLGWA